MDFRANSYKQVINFTMLHNWTLQKPTQAYRTTPKQFRINQKWSHEYRGFSICKHNFHVGGFNQRNFQRSQKFDIAHLSRGKLV